MASRERNLTVASRRHLERGCECPKWPRCVPHDAKEWGGSEPDRCSAHDHAPVRPAPDMALDDMTGENGPVRFAATWNERPAPDTALREALALADSMIRSGERHTPQSEAIIRAALEAER